MTPIQKSCKSVKESINEISHYAENENVLLRFSMLYWLQCVIDDFFTENHEYFLIDEE